MDEPVKSKALNIIERAVGAAFSPMHSPAWAKKMRPEYLYDGMRDDPKRYFLYLARVQDGDVGSFKPAKLRGSNPDFDGTVVIDSLSQVNKTPYRDDKA